MTPRARFGFASILLTLLSSLLLAGEGGYERRWVWTPKELTKIKKIEKEVTEVTVEETGEKGYRYETPYWIVISEIDPHFTAECAEFMDRLALLFLEIFDPSLFCPETPKPTVLVCKNEENYRKIRGIPGSRGVFTWAFDGEKFRVFHLYTYMEPRRTLTFSEAYHPVLLHEGTHALLQRLVGIKTLPVWLNEGFATFYEYWDLRSKGSPIGNTAADKEARRQQRVISPTEDRLKEILFARRGVYVPLRYILNLNTMEEWNVDGMGPRTAAHYALAESFSTYLMSTKETRKMLETFIKRVREETLPIVTDEEIKKLEKGYYKYLANEWGVTGKEPGPNDPQDL